MTMGSCGDSIQADLELELHAGGSRYGYCGIIHINWWACTPPTVTYRLPTKGEVSGLTIEVVQGVLTWPLFM